MKMNYFQSTQNNGSEGSVLGSVFCDLNSIDRQLSLEQKIKCVTILVILIYFGKSSVEKKTIFEVRSSDLDLRNHVP